MPGNPTNWTKLTTNATSYTKLTTNPTLWTLEDDDPSLGSLLLQNSDSLALQSGLTFALELQ